MRHIEFHATAHNSGQAQEMVDWINELYKKYSYVYLANIEHIGGFWYCWAEVDEHESN